jgi:hypothetical protein
MSGSEILVSGSLVIINGKLCEITKADTRLGRARGHDAWEIDPGNGTLPNFCEDFGVKLAVVGVNVCPKPRGQCFCGMPHVSERWHSKLPVKG